MREFGQNLLKINSQASWNPDRNLTVDEQLLPTKTSFSFTQYIPKKVSELIRWAIKISEFQNLKFKALFEVKLKLNNF